MHNPNPIVGYWDEPYVPKYMADFSGNKYISAVDSQTLYDGLENLVITVASDTTGVNTMDWFTSLEAPDIRNPFSSMVYIYIYGTELIIKIN